jgi:drug/metabolite transporter (DMT)-like permease
LLAWLAGVFFAADLILWHNAIELVGAGLATVLGNVQVVLVGLLAWALLGERPDRSSLAAIPIVGLGVVLISGALEQGAYGSNPQLGAVYGVLTGIAYAGFLLVLRQGSKDLRRPAGPLFTATLSSAICCAAIGAAIGDLDLTPSLSATGWLVVLALSSQVVGWLLISSSLPRLPAVVTSILLTLQPVLSVIFAALIVDESPSRLQLAGAGCILAGLIVATVGRRPVQTPEPELAG